MTIEKAILSAKEPKEANTAWVQPKGDSLQLNIFNNGKWRPIAGGGNSSSDSSGCGCEDVIIKGIVEGNSVNYTIEKGNFEEVYNGILSGKVYSFDISSFSSVEEVEDVFRYFGNNLIASARGRYYVAANTSRPEIKITVGSDDFTWTPEGITNEPSIG